MPDTLVLMETAADPKAVEKDSAQRLAEAWPKVVADAIHVDNAPLCRRVEGETSGVGA